MKVTATSSGPGMDKIFKGIAALNGSDVLVGIPEGDNRQDSLTALAAAMKLTKSGKPRKKAAKFIEAAKNPISNAELLFIFTNGSPLHGQPPRVVIEAAIEAEPTKSLIAKYISQAAVAAMDGNEAGMVENLQKAGTIGESASKRWFTDSRNGWDENAASTIRAKGSDTPGIDTGQMRRAITHVVQAGNVAGHNDSDGPEQDAEKGMDDVAETADEVAGGVEGAVETVGEGIAEGAEVVGEVAIL